MGLGEARASFNLGIIMLVVALAFYAVCIPLLGSQGAALAYVLSTAGIALVAMAMLRKHVPVTMMGIASRWHDVRMFIVRRVMHASERN